MIDEKRRPAFLELKSEPEYQSLSPPHTPATPLTPIVFSSSPSTTSFQYSSLLTLPAFEPPCSPLPWLWSCHICHTRYALGTTRRCLLDGHYFCAGETPTKKTGRKKRHRPCGSEFDYVGWTEYGDWRRGVKGMPFKWQGPGKNCNNYCNFPSECRWSKKLNGDVKAVSTETQKVEPVAEEQDVDMGDAEAVPTIEEIDQGLIKDQEESMTVSASSMLKKVLRSAEKRSAGLKTTLLTTSSSGDITDQTSKGERLEVATPGSISLQRGLAKMAVICRIPETLYEYD